MCFVGCVFTRTHDVLCHEMINDRSLEPLTRQYTDLLLDWPPSLKTHQETRMMWCTERFPRQKKAPRKSREYETKKKQSKTISFPQSLMAWFEVYLRVNVCKCVCGGLWLTPGSIRFLSAASLQGNKSIVVSPGVRGLWRICSSESSVMVAIGTLLKSSSFFRTINWRRSRLRTKA